MSGREAGIDPQCRLELSFRYVPIPIVLGGNQSEGNVSSGQRRVEFNGSLRCGFRSRHGFVRRKNQIRGVIVGVGQAAVSQGVCRIVIDGILQVVKGFAVPVFGVVIGREVSTAQIVGVGGGVCGGAFAQSTLLLASKGAAKVCAHKGLASRTRRRRTETRMRLSAVWTLPSTTASTLRSRPLWMGSWSANRLTVAKGRTINCIFASRVITASVSPRPR